MLTESLPEVRFPDSQFSAGFFFFFFWFCCLFCLVCFLILNIYFTLTKETAHASLCFISLKQFHFASIKNVKIN